MHDNSDDNNDNERSLRPSAILATVSFSIIHVRKSPINKKNNVTIRFSRRHGKNSMFRCRFTISVAVIYLSYFANKNCFRGFFSHLFFSTKKKWSSRPTHLSNKSSKESDSICKLLLLCFRICLAQFCYLITREREYRTWHVLLWVNWLSRMHGMMTNTENMENCTANTNKCVLIFQTIMKMMNSAQWINWDFRRPFEISNASFAIIE